MPRRKVVTKLPSNPVVPSPVPAASSNGHARSTHRGGREELRPIEHSKKESSSRRSSSVNLPPEEKKKSDHKPKKIDMDNLRGRRPISGVSMNLNGRHSLIGNLPQYKINYITDFLKECEPDLLFFQDSLTADRMTEILEGGNKKYKLHWQFVKEDSNNNEKEDEHGGIPPPFTAIAWDTEKYFGTPLELTDNRLGALAKWVASHNITVVKVDSMVTMGPYEDVYPSFIAISWHGMDTDTPLRKRNEECKNFLDFVNTLRINNRNIPVLVGGDFNLDLRNFHEINDFPGLLFVPHRPGSAYGGKDLKNTFLYTMDTLQIIETKIKQFHPDVFSCPWVVVSVKGRSQLKIWALIKLQRAVRSYIEKKRARKEASKQLTVTKERWKKKLEGEDYKPPPKTPQKPKEKPKSEVPLKSNSGTPASGGAEATHRRKKYNDLKSIQERKQEQSEINQWLES